jgi:hypothetical protein
MKISASQIALAYQCPRKWAFKYIARLPEPPSDSQSLGITVHAILENYLRDGTPIDATTDEGRIAQAGMRFLPRPGTGHAEKAFTIEEGDFRFVGSIDWMSFDGSEVVDHKTTSNFRWMKSADDLRKDPQGILYARAGQGDVVTEKWIYYKTRDNPISRVTELVWTREEIDAAYEGLRAEAHTLVTLRRKEVEPNSLPANPAYCFAYGKPCPYTMSCNVSAIERMKKMSFNKDDLMSQLLAKSLGTVAPTTPPAAVEPPAPPVAPAAASNIDALNALMSRPAEPAVEPVTDLLIDLVEAPVKPAPVEAAPVAEKPKRTRAKKAEPAVEVAPVAEPVEAAPVEPVVPWPRIDTLYVDCVPFGAPVVPASDYFARTHEKIKLELGEEHYKLMKFGAGPGVFVATLRTLIQYTPAMFVSSRSLEGSDALEYLCSISGTVVRAVT